MINLSRRSFIKLSLGSAAILAVPISLTSKTILSSDFTEKASFYSNKAFSYSMTAQDAFINYLALSGLWAVDFLAALLAFISTICLLVVTALMI